METRSSETKEKRRQETRSKVVRKEATGKMVLSTSTAYYERAELKEEAVTASRKRKLAYLTRECSLHLANDSQLRSLLFSLRLGQSGHPCDARQCSLGPPSELPTPCSSWHHASRFPALGELSSFLTKQRSYYPSNDSRNTH